MFAFNSDRLADWQIITVALWAVPGTVYTYGYFLGDSYQL